MTNIRGARVACTVPYGHRCCVLANPNRFVRICPGMWTLGLVGVTGELMNGSATSPGLELTGQ